MSVNMNAGMRLVDKHGTAEQYGKGAGETDIESPFNPISRVRPE